MLCSLNCVGAITTEMAEPDAPSHSSEMSSEDVLQSVEHMVQTSPETTVLPSVSIGQSPQVESADTQTAENTPPSDVQTKFQKELRATVPATNTSKEVLYLASVTPRKLFTDGWNSAWHLIFGLFAVKMGWLMPVFIFYQFLDDTDANMIVDILEFLVGYIVGYVFHHVL